MSWLSQGFEVFPPEPAVEDWVRSVRAPALAAAADYAQRAVWLRHGGTWFVGVDALPNDVHGAVGRGPAFAGAAFDAAVAATGIARLHRAQLSVTYPGYPLQDAEESAAAHRFRTQRDAAHLDGLLPEGPDKRRHLREPHAWILGVALTEADVGASPLVVWEGSHELIRRAFARVFEGVPAPEWGDVDVTEIYKAARAEVFEGCRRVEVPLAPGDAVLLHRHVIHGVAPWTDGAKAATEGRAIAYFRPCFEDPSDWLERP
ncbi:phytanoyl-CoA dioxygenase family protein [Gymnodinialimonas ulvae]|uniref:phytanoyl-CoA dioxygenase family protein n=1 Tax=Gymnodinialimonas ulvae TaxID=3126504 RepID=UPI0030B543DD